MEAFVSLVTNDSYAQGAIVLGMSLRVSGTLRKLALLITREVSMDMRHRLCRLWDELVLVEELDSGDAEHLSLLTRPELGVTFSKIHAWRLTQYTKCVFLDADAMLLQNVDELFEREELSAAPDIGWPDCFNSGVFVFQPSLETFSNLLDLARQRGSFDGGDQGLLNTYWSEWATKDIKYHLPFIYNVTPNITYGYAPAFQQFGRNIKIIHFIGSTKPWHHRYLSDLDSVILSPGTYSSEHASQDYIRRWWQLYTQEEQPHCQSCDWPSWDAPPSTCHSPSYHTPSHHTSSHHTHSYHTPSHHTPSHHTPSPHAPSPSSHPHYTPFVPPHIVTHTHHTSTGHPTLVVSTNNPSLTPIHWHHTPDIIESHDHHPIRETTPTTPSYIIYPYPDHHSHTSLSFYSHEDLFDRTADTVSVEPHTPHSGKVHSFNDLEALNASIYRKLNTISLDDDIVPTLRISYPYSSSIFVGPPSSVHSSRGIDIPSPFSQSDYSFVPYKPPQSLTPHIDSDYPSTESDAYSLPEDTSSEHVVSCSSLPLSEGEEESGKSNLSDSVLTNVTSLSPSTHTHPTTLKPLAHVDKEPLVEGPSSPALIVSGKVTKSEEQVNFEQGNIDYNGQDSFDSIQKHINKMLKDV